MSLGPGDRDCPHCEGKGILKELVFNTSLERGSHPPRFRRCQCVLQRDIAANVERGMRKLMQAPRIAESPLTDDLEDDLWVTASQTWFMANLRHIAIRQPPTWYFKVVTDADLMTSWLASVALKGREILDPDAAKVSLTHVTLVDLVMPPELLVIRLGIKQARNVATPEVFLEALRHREHAGLPTWVWDTPREQLLEGHICWSVMVAEYLSTWRHVKTRDVHVAPKPGPTPTRNPHTDWASGPEKSPSDGESEYEDADPTEAVKSGEIEALKGTGGHVDFTPTGPFRPTMSSGGGRKSLRDTDGEDK